MFEEKINLLKKVIGEDFVSTNPNVGRCFISENTEAILIRKADLIKELENNIDNEIWTYSNKLLINFLPEKYWNDVILDDLKDMAKRDHTILSDLIINKSRFYSYMIENHIKSIKDFILEDSIWKESGDYCIFYAKK